MKLMECLNICLWHVCLFSIHVGILDEWIFYHCNLCCSSSTCGVGLESMTWIQWSDLRGPVGSVSLVQRCVCVASVADNAVWSCSVLDMTVRCSRYRTVFAVVTRMLVCSWKFHGVFVCRWLVPGQSGPHFSRSTWCMCRTVRSACIE